MLGTITGIGGAMMLTFLKGVEINIWTFHINLLHKGKNGTINDDSGSKLLGIFFGLGSCFCFALWLIIQVKIIKKKIKLNLQYFRRWITDKNRIILRMQLNFFKKYTYKFLYKLYFKPRLKYDSDSAIVLRIKLRF